MASSKRPARRRAPAKRKLSDTAPLDPILSRSATKKQKSTRSTRREPLRDDSHNTELVRDDDDSDDTASDSDLQEVADAVITHLAVSCEPVAASMDWANTKIENQHGNTVSAYAKVCGRDWTYYVKSPKVSFGRPPDASSRPSMGAESSPALHLDDSSAVHIDLGPNKLVSRLHAELFFDQEDSKWHIIVNGRNGVRLNDQSLRRGQRNIINSGDVLDIAGTEMMFVTAGTRPVVHQMYQEKLREIGYPGIRSQAISSHARTPLQKSAQYRVNGQAVIAPAPPDFVRPLTPTRSPTKLGKPSSGSKESPAYGRGIVMESNEQIDYRSSASRDIKPSWSYATMISQAIMSTPEQYLSLDGIYRWIMANFSYYRHVQSNWQNSIRHNLSLSTAFKKIPRGANDPGKGANWAIVPDKKEELIAAWEKQMRRNGARRSSAPSSPAMKDPLGKLDASSSQPQAHSSNGNVKMSPTILTPPLSSYPPTAQESYTPSRGPQFASYDTHQTLPILSDNPSPLAARRPPGRTAGGSGSSPTLTSGAWLHENHPNPMVTPAPRQYNLNLPLPNTVKLPTSHMPDSSPAPFWKWTDQAGSTPTRWPGEISPLKAGALESSSPPPAVTNGVESPTRGRGFLPSNLHRTVEADDEEGGFDLARGFPKISAYHHYRSNMAAASHNVAS